MTVAEQEYIKQIYLGTAEKDKTMHTRELALLLSTRPASSPSQLRP